MEKVGAGPRKLENFNQEKILIKDVAKEIIAAFDSCNYLTTDTVTICFNPKKGYDLKFIIALLNSKFIKEWFNSNFDSGLHIKINQLSSIPILKLDLKKASEKAAHDKLVNLVEQMIEAKQKLQELVLDKDINYYEQKCNRLDKQIDSLVYELYGLSEEEIAIIENN
jgi:hypothetical protein